MVTKLVSAVRRFILPPDLAVRMRRLELMVWALLLSLAFYPGWFGILAWIALVRPIFILKDLSPRDAFRSAYWFSFFFNAFSLYWVALVTPPGTVMAILIVSFYYAGMLMAFHGVYRWRAAVGYGLLPFLWVGMEYFRTLSQFAFPWSDLGYTQAYFPYLLQIVSAVSVHGLSLIILAVNVLLVQVFRRGLSPERRLTSVFAAVGLVALTAAYGWIMMPPYPMSGTLNVALLQGSVPLEVKWAKEKRERNFELYDSLIQTTDPAEISLYVWPETSIPCYVSHDYGCRARLSNIVRGTRTPHLIGALGAREANGEQRFYNSAFQFAGDGRIDRSYRKVKLVPFSEQVPYQDRLPFLRARVLEKYLTFIKTYDVQWWSDFYPGDSSGVFSLEESDYGLLICFESAFPEYARSMVKEGAGFLVGITNDTWFRNSVGIYMHARIFITRAVENGVWGVRVANSGLSFVVDPNGRIRDQLDYNDVAALISSIRPATSVSVFARNGDLAGKVSFLILVSCIGIFAIRWITRIPARKRR